MKRLDWEGNNNACEHDLEDVLGVKVGLGEVGNLTLVSVGVALCHQQAPEVSTRFIHQIVLQ